MPMIRCDEKTKQVLRRYRRFVAATAVSGRYPNEQLKLHFQSCSEECLIRAAIYEAIRRTREIYKGRERKK